MQRYFFSALSDGEKNILCQRGKTTDNLQVFETCKTIESEVMANGDSALYAFAKQFDGADLKHLAVLPKEFSQGQMVSASLQEAIRQAEQNIRLFHEQQKCSISEIETLTGVRCWRETRPLETVGLYIPGGTAPLFSTVLMLGIPARIAGVETIVLCTPPDRHGNVAPEILWTADFLGIDRIYKVGGAQAVFAMAHGTETIPRVDKIFGPGNQYVTTAKQIVSTTTAIDMPAGPSEVLVLADAAANPVFVAADLLSQAEHGPDSQAILVTDSVDMADAVESELERQISNLPRKDIAQKALAQSYILLCGSLEEGLGFSNLYAPEHLILHSNDWETLQPRVKHAGSVFCGEWSPESAGDYASGTNHTLPTAGFARSFSGVSVDSFTKPISFQHLSRSGLGALGETIETMARAEGLDAHANAVSVRLAADD